MTTRAYPEIFWGRGFKKFFVWTGKFRGGFGISQKKILKKGGGGWPPKTPLNTPLNDDILEILHHDVKFYQKSFADCEQVQWLFLSFVLGSVMEKLNLISKYCCRMRKYAQFNLNFIFWRFYIMTLNSLKNHLQIVNRFNDCFWKWSPSPALFIAIAGGEKLSVKWKILLHITTILHHFTMILHHFRTILMIKIVVKWSKILQTVILPLHHRQLSFQMSCNF